MKADERAIFWLRIINGSEYIIDLETAKEFMKNCAYNNCDAVDEYVKNKYAEQLKQPEVMARLLGSKNDK